MKTKVDMKTPGERALPFIGVNNFSAAVILFTATASRAFPAKADTMIKGIILEPGASEHAVGQWVTYERRDVAPLVGTITLEN